MLASVVRSTLGTANWDSLGSVEDGELPDLRDSLATHWSGGFRGAEAKTEGVGCGRLWLAGGNSNGLARPPYSLTII